MRLVINEDDCGGEAREFAAFVRRTHPEITIDYREQVSGFDGGLYDDGNPVQNNLWDEYCNSATRR